MDEKHVCVLFGEHRESEASTQERESSRREEKHAHLCVSYQAVRARAGAITEDHLGDQGEKVNSNWLNKKNSVWV